MFAFRYLLAQIPEQKYSTEVFESEFFPPHRQMGFTDAIKYAEKKDDV
jgi:hypothetical protein